MAGTGETSTLDRRAPDHGIPGGIPGLVAPIRRPRRPTADEQRMADALRALAIDAADAAGSGPPVMPLGMADAAAALWSRALRFDAGDPRWPDRDRFVLSAGHGSMLLYALLHLTGHAGMELEALRRFRQLHSPAAGHPDHAEHPAIETTTGPPGQGFATAVGMALAERMMAARFGRSLVDHRTWVIASDGDLMEGVSHEAACLAGHLRLEKLAVLWDDNSVSLDGDASLSRSDDPLRRFAAAGWATKRVDGHDGAAIAAALSSATRSRKPVLIACRTSARSPARLPGGDGAAWSGAAAKRAFGWDEAPFEVPRHLVEQWRRAGARGTGLRRAWLKRLATHPLRAEFERVLAGRLPDAWHEATAALKAELAESRPAHATRQSSQRVLDALAAAMPELVGGSAGLTRSDLAQARGMAAVGPGQYAGRYVHYGVREHAMAACLNGLALHGGLRPYAGALLVFTDYMRPALRLAALMRQRVIHVLTHDSIGLGGDGATHQPVEHLASLRAMPGLCVLRPADAIETVECWDLAIRRGEGPSLLVLSRQAVPAVRADVAENRSARGGYVLAEADGARQATLIASGSEVSVALRARDLLAGHGIAAAVVSLPCWDLFAAQDESYHAQVLGSALRVGVEAACGFGWERWLGADGIFIGMTGFGASAPGEALYQHFGITPEAIALAARKRLQPEHFQKDEVYGG